MVGGGLQALAAGRKLGQIEICIYIKYGYHGNICMYI